LNKTLQKPIPNLLMKEGMKFHCNDPQSY